MFISDTIQISARPVDNNRDTAQISLVSYYVALAVFLDSCVAPMRRPAVDQAGKPLPSMRDAVAVFQAEWPGLLAALGLAAQRGWGEQVQRLSGSKGEPLRILRYFDDLLTVAQAAVFAARHTADIAAEGGTLNNLGMTYREVRRFEDAITCHQQSLAIFRETGDRVGEGRSWVTSARPIRGCGGSRRPSPATSKR